MTSGVGNPDWQRRYVFSAVPLYSALFSVSGTIVSPVIDANGFTYIILTSQAQGTTAFIHITVNWFQDSAGTILIGGTDFVTVPGAADSIKIPAAARYFKIQTTNVGGGTTGNTLILTYGSTADQYDVMTGVTSTPLVAISASLGSGVTSTAAFTHLLPGRVMVQFNHATNSNWLGFIEYYDWTTASWHIFYNAYGASKGQSWVEHIWLPFAPIRANVRNTDAAAQVTEMYVITADTP